MRGQIEKLQGSLQGVTLEEVQSSRLAHREGSGRGGTGKALLTTDLERQAAQALEKQRGVIWSQAPL